MKTTILAFALLLSMLGCGGPKVPPAEPPKPALFSMKFGKASTLDATIVPGSPATPKEYRAAINSVIKKK